MRTQSGLPSQNINKEMFKLDDYDSVSNLILESVYKQFCENISAIFSFS